KKPLIILANKADQLNEQRKADIRTGIPEALFLSAKTGEGLEVLRNKLLDRVQTGILQQGDAVVTNTRHYDSLTKALEALQRVYTGIQEGIPSDLMAIDLKDALYHLGQITGQVTHDELLGNIFANFCIAK